MSEIIVICDRCGAKVDGWLSEGFTAGFYDVSHHGPWHRFAHSAYETQICDSCMWADEQYQELYGHDAQMQEWMREKTP